VLWPCEFAIAGKPCQYCFSAASSNRWQGAAGRCARSPAEDFCEITDMRSVAAASTACRSRAAPLRRKAEEKYITDYLTALRTTGLRELLTGEVLLYITPPAAHETIDRYLPSARTASPARWRSGTMTSRGRSRRAWREFTTKARHLDALCYTAERFGPGKAFSNSSSALSRWRASGRAQTISRRGVIPAASSGCRSASRSRLDEAAGADYYRAVIDILGELYENTVSIPPAPADSTSASKRTSGTSGTAGAGMRAADGG
jgi:hypothetical protein